MAQFESRVRTFAGVPLDRSLSHTIWFRENDDTADAKDIRVRQRDFFARYFLQHEYTGYQFQRVSDGVVQVQTGHESLDDINYIALSNVEPESGSERWYYGFVDYVRYINNHNTEIHYTLDPLQCYQDAVAFGESFIERHHVLPGTVDDQIGGNLQPENFGLGSYVNNHVSHLGDTFEVPRVDKTKTEAGEDTYGIYGWYCVVAQISNVALYVHGYKPMPIWLRAFDNFGDLGKYLSTMADLGDTSEIISIYMVPKKIWDASKDEGQEDKTLQNPGSYISGDFKFNLYKQIDGYTPMHNKMYTYPYNFITVTNNAGAYMQVKYEDWIETGAGVPNYGPEDPETKVPFRIYCDITPGSKPVCAPKYPLGEKHSASDASKFAFHRGLTLPPFPQVPVATDSYAIWLAQNQGSNEVANLSVAVQKGKAFTSLATGTVAAVASGLLGNIPGAVMGAGVATMGFYNNMVDASLSAAQNQARYQDAQAMPDHITGLSAPDTQYSVGEYAFTAFQTSIKREIAETIDEYWLRFGYPMNKILPPRPALMPRYTYIKAPDVNVKSRQLGATNRWGAPQWCMDGWKRAFQNGITFWKWTAVMASETDYAIFSYGGNGRGRVD